MLREYDDMKVAVENLRLQQFIKYFDLFIKQCYLIVWSAEKIQIVKPKGRKNKKSKSNGFIFSSKYALFDSKKSRFIKEQEVSELSNILGLKISSSNIPILGDIFLKR